MEEDLHKERQHEGQKVGVDCRQSELGKGKSGDHGAWSGGRICFTAFSTLVSEAEVCKLLATGIIE